MRRSDWINGKDEDRRKKVAPVGEWVSVDDFLPDEDVPVLIGENGQYSKDFYVHYKRHGDGADFWMGEDGEDLADRDPRTDFAEGEPVIIHPTHWYKVPLP